MSLRTEDKLKFRPDINGLRAWAVMVVVLYHFGVPGFSGGFIGVDVFFVVSGFLMTGIVVGGLEGQRGRQFSLASFYLARARRILPALIVLCGGLLALGWFALPSADYRTLATHALASLAFLSNVKFWREAGYFDIAAHDKWLLHTWSLSVEWQFYLLFPLALMFWWKFFPGRRRAQIVILAGALLSFASSLVLTARAPSAAFFLLPARAWELLAGGLVFFSTAAAGSRTSEEERGGGGRAMEALGFAFILVSVVTADADAWPGWQALLPVAGTCLVLGASRAQSHWTSPAPLQALGRWSYSIYLWHWPLVVALAYFELQASPAVIAVFTVASIALGAASYRWVEQPSRVGLVQIRPVPAMQALAGATILVAAPAAALRLADGVPARMPAAVELAAREAGNVNQRRTECHMMGGTDFHHCLYGGPDVRVALVGDSHASTVVNAVHAALPSPTDGVLAFSYTSCPTIFGAHHVRPELECAAFNEWVRTQLEALPASVPVIVVNRSSAYLFGRSHLPGAEAKPPSIFFDRAPPTVPDAAWLHEYEKRLVASACALARGRTVYLVRPLPEMTVDVPRAVARKLLLGKPLDIGISLDDYSRRHAFIRAAQDKAVNTCGVRVLDPLPWLCTDGWCSATEAGRPRYYDDNHLSEFGNRPLIPMFKAQLRPL